MKFDRINDGRWAGSIRFAHYFRTASVILLYIAFQLVLPVLITGCSSSGHQEGLRTGELKTGELKSKTEHTGDRNDNKAEQEPVSRDIFAMDTYMTLTAYGEQGEEALDAAVSEIERIENLVSTGIESSEISMINRNGKADVSEDTALLINRSKELYKETGGIFDITIYPVMQAWGFTTGNYRIPDEQELKTLLSNMNPEDILCENNQVVIEREGMEIDLGGIAKGYTSGRVMEVFREYGVEHAVISLGGNVHTLGAKPDDSSWRVAIEDPKDTSDYIGIVKVRDKAVITSGGYERFFEQDGKTYHHIIDPSTGYPAESGLNSVTIVSEDGTLADGLSTSLFIMGKEKAADYWRRHASEFDAVFVEENEHVLVTEGIADDFSSERDWEVIHD